MWTLILMSILVYVYVGVFIITYDTRSESVHEQSVTVCYIFYGKLRLRGSKIILKGVIYSKW